MATVYWLGNGAQNTSQQVVITVTGVAVGGELTATINGKTVVYTIVSGDTTSTAAAAWQALLASADAPLEMQDITWSVDGATITGVANTPGTPFMPPSGTAWGLVCSGTLGATLTQTQTVANQSVSDATDIRNWRRNGIAALPQNGDDMVIADASTPILWNIDGLAGVRLASYTRWQSYTGAIGLPDQNAAGYPEYRPTYFQFSGGLGSGSSSSAGGTANAVLNMTLGIGSGQGPSLERYNVGSQQVNLVLSAAGSPSQTYSVYFLGTNGANTLTVVGSSLGVAMAPGETASLATAKVVSGGTLALGPGCTVVTSVYANAGTLLLTGCAPPSVSADNGSTVIQSTTAANPQLTYPTFVAQGGTTVSWLSGSNISTFSLFTGSSFDKSQDPRTMQITTMTIDASTCQVSDPYSCISYTNAPTARDAINAGPFLRGPNSTIKVA